MIPEPFQTLVRRTKVAVAMMQPKFSRTTVKRLLLCIDVMNAMNVRPERAAAILAEVESKRDIRRRAKEKRRQRQSA